MRIPDFGNLSPGAYFLSGFRHWERFTLPEKQTYTALFKTEKTREDENRGEDREILQEGSHVPLNCGLLPDGRLKSALGPCFRHIPRSGIGSIFRDMELKSEGMKGLYGKPSASLPDHKEAGPRKRMKRITTIPVFRWILARHLIRPFFLRGSKSRNQRRPSGERESVLFLRIRRGPARSFQLGTDIFQQIERNVAEFGEPQMTGKALEFFPDPFSSFRQLRRQDNPGGGKRMADGVFFLPDAWRCGVP